MFTASLIKLCVTPLISVLFFGGVCESLKKGYINKWLGVWARKDLCVLISIYPYILSIQLWINFDKINPFLQCKSLYDVLWIDSFYGVSLQLGIDGISIFFVVLTTFIMPFCILTVDAPEIKDKFIFWTSLFLLESLLLISFCAIDLLLFFICFESVIIPMFIIMKRGSQAQKIKASYYFVLYTLAGSLPLFVGILFLCSAIGSTNFEILSFCFEEFFCKYQNVLWWFFFFGFATKIPMFPVQ